MRRELFFFFILVACRKGPSTSASGVTVGTTIDANDDASRASDTVQSARCHPTERSVRLDETREPTRGGLDVEMGDAVAFGDRYAVSFLHSTPAGRSSAVALLDAQAAGARVVDLAPIPFGDAPPPRLALCGNALVAVSYGMSPAVARSGQLVVSVVDALGATRPVLTIPQHRDDSLSFDFACTRGAEGLVVWDETATPSPGDSAPRGVVRAAAFEVGHPGVRVWDVSPPDSDAETARVVAQAGGFSVLWIARRPETPKGEPKGGEPGSPGAGPSQGEATGEARTYGWLEMTSVDADAGVAGPVRRLTPTSGHVSAYDAQPVEPSKAVVWVVARDDGESTDSAGGTLMRIRVRPEGIEAPVLVPTDGLGRGPPTFVGGAAPWLAWVSAREQLRLLPVGEGDQPGARASAEDSLEEARPLLSLAEADRVLVATTADVGAQLRVFMCRR